MSAAVMGNWTCGCKHFIFKSLHFVSNRPHQRLSEAVTFITPHVNRVPGGAPNTLMVFLLLHTQLWRLKRMICPEGGARL